MNLVFLYPMKPTLAPKNNVYLKQKKWKKKL